MSLMVEIDRNMSNWPSNDLLCIADFICLDVMRLAGVSGAPKISFDVIGRGSRVMLNRGEDKRRRHFTLVMPRLPTSTPLEQLGGVYLSGESRRHVETVLARAFLTVGCWWGKVDSHTADASHFPIRYDPKWISDVERKQLNKRIRSERSAQRIKTAERVIETHTAKADVLRVKLDRVERLIEKNRSLIQRLLDK
jgi:hypothetical protein